MYGKVLQKDVWADAPKVFRQEDHDLHTPACPFAESDNTNED